MTLLLDNDGRGAILVIAGVLMFITIRPTIAQLRTDRQRITP